MEWHVFWYISLLLTPVGLSASTQRNKSAKRLSSSHPLVLLSSCPFVLFPPAPAAVALVLVAPTVAKTVIKKSYLPAWFSNHAWNAC